MTQFEFVQVTLVIVLGLGLTDILRNLGEQYRHRQDIKVSWLQIMASCLLLSVILIVYLWSFWSTSDVEWNLTLFVLQAGSAVALALSAQFIRVDLSSDKALSVQYFENCRVTYATWAMAPLFGLLFSIATNNLSVLDAPRVFVAALLVSMGFIKAPAYHVVILSTLLFIVVVIAPISGGLVTEL